MENLDTILLIGYIHALSALLRFVLRDQQYAASTCSALKTTCISVIEMDICIQYCYFVIHIIIQEVFLLSLDDKTVVGLMLSIDVAAMEDDGVISKAARLCMAEHLSLL